MKHILLVDADGVNGFPNLALMKISTWRKANHDSVDLIRGIPDAPPLAKYDQAYISCIFFQNRDKVMAYYGILDCPVSVGGSGWDLNNTLWDDVEHMMPDYDLYPTAFSIGFTSRGCIRHCGFCIIPAKEGRITDNAPISEFWKSEHDRLVLLDNNFLASPKWRENLDFIEQHDLKVNFNQGLDIRLLNREKAERLAAITSYDWHFKTKGFYFAFDSLSIEQQIRQGIELLSEIGIHPRKLLFYVLVGYDSTEQEDFRRIQIIKELGAIPFAMLYNNSQDKRLRHFARWVNRRYYQFVDWRDYLKKAEKE